MSIEAGTPKIGQKIAVLFGFGAAIGLTPEQIALVQAGDNRDLTKGEQVVLELLQPVLNAGESDVMGDLAVMLKAVLTAIPTITSISHASDIIGAVLQAEGGTLQKQAVALGQSGLITLISAALSAVGKTNLPLVG